MMEGLAAANATPKTIMIDATYLRAHHTASSCGLKGSLGRCIGRTRERACWPDVAVCRPFIFRPIATIPTLSAVPTRATPLLEGTGRDVPPTPRARRSPSALQ